MDIENLGHKSGDIVFSSYIWWERSPRCVIKMTSSLKRSVCLKHR